MTLEFTFQIRFIFEIAQPCRSDEQHGSLSVVDAVDTVDAEICQCLK